jgi:hypothetical protein
MIFERRLSEELFFTTPETDNDMEKNVYKNPTASEFEQLFREAEGFNDQTTRIKLALSTDGNLYAWSEGEHTDMINDADILYSKIKMTMYLYQNVSDPIHKWDDDGEYRDLPVIEGLVLNTSVSSTPSWGAFPNATNRITPTLAKILKKRIPALKWILGNEVLFDTEGNRLPPKKSDWSAILKIMAHEGLQKKQ